MQVSNDWPMDEPFGGPGLPDCTIDICEHSAIFYECGICYVKPQKTPRIKKKKKLQQVVSVFLFPLYLLGALAYGVVAFFRFVADGGLFGLMIVGWTISGIYHFFFVFIPYILSFLL